MTSIEQLRRIDVVRAIGVANRGAAGLYEESNNEIDVSVIS